MGARAEEAAADKTLGCFLCGRTTCGDHACDTVVEEWEILAERCAKAKHDGTMNAALPWQEGLPAVIRTTLEEEILVDQEGFKRRVSDYAYAQAMGKVHVSEEDL